MQALILESFFEGMNRRDFASLCNLYSPDALIHSRQGVVRGPQGLESIVKRWLTAFPDLLLFPLHTSQENDVIVVHWRAVGTHVETLLDIQPTGKKIAFHGLTCFRVQNQKVIEHWACTDFHTLRSSSRDACPFSTM